MSKSKRGNKLKLQISNRRKRVYTFHKTRYFKTHYTFLKWNILIAHTSPKWVDKCLLCGVEVHGSQLCGKRQCNNQL